MDDITQRLRFELEASYMGVRNMSGIERDIAHIGDLWKQGVVGKMKLGTDVGIGAGAGAVGIGAWAAKQAVDTESAANRLKATYQVSQRDFDSYSKFIESKSAGLLQSQKDLWDGLGNIIQAGFTGKVATQIETGAAKIATIFNTTLPDAIKPATIAMRDFHTSASNTFDLLAKAASMTPGGWSALFSGATSRVFRAASQSGVSLQDVLGADVTLARQTGGGRAMGALQSLFVSLGNVPGSQHDLQTFGLVPTIQHLLSLYQGDPKSLNKVFGGKLGVSYAETLATGGANLGKTQGYVDTTFGKISKELPEQWKELKLQMEGAAIAIGKALIPALQSFTNWITPIAKGISDWSSKNAILVGDTLKIVAGVGAVSLAIRVWLGFFGPLKTAFDYLGGKLSSTRAAVQDVNNVTNDLATNKMPAMKQAEQNVGTVVQDMSSNKLPALQSATQKTASHIEDLYGNRLPILNTEMQTVGKTAVTTAETDLAALTTAEKTMGDAAVVTAGESEMGALRLSIFNLGEAAMTAAPLIGLAMIALQNAGQVAKETSQTQFAPGTPVNQLFPNTMSGAALIMNRHGSGPGETGTLVGPDAQQIPVVKNSKGQWVVAGPPSNGKLPGYTDPNGLIGLGAGAPQAVVNSASGVARWWPQIVAASKATGVPAYVIAAYMSGESGGDPTALSSAGAYGLMQLMPTTETGYNHYDPGQNIMGGAALIASGMAQYGTNWEAIYENVYNPGILNTPNDGGYLTIMRNLGAWGGTGAGGYVPLPPTGGGGGGGFLSALAPTPVKGPAAAKAAALRAALQPDVNAIASERAGVSELGNMRKNYAVGSNTWLHLTYRIDELRRAIADQTAHERLLRGEISKNTYASIVNSDRLAADAANRAARLHHLRAIGGGAAASHVVPVRIADQCTEVAKTNGHIKDGNQAIKDMHKGVKDSGHDVVTAVNRVHQAIAHLSHLLEHGHLSPHEGSHTPTSGNPVVIHAH